MRVVADTNTIVSGVLWHGAPRQVLDAARVGRLALYTSAPLVAELAEVLSRPKFAQRLALAEVTPQTVVIGYAVLAHLIVPATIGPVVEEDPDDDAVLACAVAARAEVIVSGVSDLLDLESYEGMPIITAAQLLARLASCSHNPCKTRVGSQRSLASAPVSLPLCSGYHRVSRSS